MSTFIGETTKSDLITNFVPQMLSQNASIFIGSGLSVQCGLPSWKKLMKEPFSKVFGREIDNGDYDYYDIADKYIQQSTDSSRTIIENLLLDHIPTNENGCPPSNIHKLIARLPLRKIWTTNWDLVIEKSLRDQGKKVTIFRGDHDFPNNQIEDVKLYKVHGCISLPSKIVVTKSDVYSYNREYEVMNNAFFSALAEDTFLFLGFSFKDSNLKSIIGRLYANYKSNARRHYAVLRRPHISSVSDNYKFSITVKDLAKFNINVLPVNDHSEIPLLLKDIEKMSLRRHIFVSGSYKKDVLAHFHNIENFKYDLAKFLSYDSLFNKQRKTYSIDSEYSLLTNRIHSLLSLEDTKILAEKIQNENWFSDSKYILETFLFSLGQNLIDNKVSIYSGFGIGICDAIVAGATKRFYTKQADYRSIFNHVKVVPLPVHRDWKDFNSAFYRSSMIGACGFMIIARGSTYASDFSSGTFEEYNILRGLSSVLNGKQKRILNTVNHILGIKYHENMEYVFDMNTFNKAFSESRMEHADKCEYVKSKLKILIEDQANILYYKYNELSGIFKILFNEEWKLVLRQLEGVKASLATYISLRDVNTNSKFKKIFNDLERIIKDLSSLIINRAQIHYQQFSQPKLFNTEYKRKVSSTIMDLLDSLIHEQVYNKIQTLYYKIHEGEPGYDLLELHQPSSSKEGSNKMLLKSLEIANSLIGADYKYLKIFKITYQLSEIEISYSSELFDIWHKKTFKSGIASSKLNQQKASKIILKKLFDNYEGILGDLMVNVHSNATKLRASDDGGGTSGRKKKIFIHKSMTGINHYWLERIDETRSIINSKWKFRQNLKSKKSSNTLKFKLREILVQYADDLNFLDNDELKDFEKYLEEKTLSVIVKKYKERFTTEKSKAIGALHFNKLTDEEKEKILASLQRKLNKGYWKELEIHKKLIVSEEVYSRKYILIYRTQLYKLLNILSNINVGLSRIETNYSESRLKEERYKSSSQARDLWSTDIFATDTTVFRSGSQKILNDEAIKYNPFMYDPNKMDHYINRQKQFYAYYERNVDVHSKMRQISQILNDAFVECSNWDGENQDIKKMPHGFIAKGIRGYEDIVRLTKEIFDIDAREKNNFKSEPYRAASIVMPIGYFGGMAKKIWESERFRFELLVENRKIGDAETLRLLREFYNLYFPRDYEIEEKVINNKLTYVANTKVVDSLLKSVFNIIYEFQKPSLV